MKTIVADSSVLVKWGSADGEQDLDRADKLLKDAQNGKIEIISPELAKYEVGNAFIKKGLSLPQLAISLATVHSSPVKFISESEELALKTFEIASSGMTYYDAAFVALAKQKRAVLVTANFKHQGKTSGAKVVSLENY